LLSPAEALANWPALTTDGVMLERLQNGVAPCLADLIGDEPAVGTRVRLVAGDTLVAVARYTPGGHGKSPGDFELLKVFPFAEETG
jgi:hypothetical protein